MYINQAFNKNKVLDDIKSHSVWFVLLYGIFLLFVSQLASKINFMLFFGAFPFLLIALLNFHAILFILPILLFVNYHPYSYSISEYFVLFISLSFVATHNEIHWNDFKFPLRNYFLIYFSILVLSVVKSINPVLSLFSLYHYVNFLFLISILYATVKDEKTISTIIKIYLITLSINTIYVIIEAISTGKRAYGFAGLMYVDYISLGIVLTSVLLIFSRTVHLKIAYSILLLFYTTGSILTQTRNVWMSTLITFSLVYLYIFVKRQYFSIALHSFKKFTIIIIVLFAIGIAAAIFLNPKTLTRITDSSQVAQGEISESGIVKNSLVTRLLIWHTAYNAFIQNPILGIGAYSFPFSSQNYYTINKLLYKEYVSKLTPHETFIAVAVETGTIGFIVFVILNITILRSIYNSSLTYSGQSDKQLGILIGSGILYCLVSMFTTDAWLWGHGIVLFGILLGLFFAHTAIAKKIVQVQV